MQDIVDPITDEMLATFVVDSHARSQPKGSTLEDHPASISQEDFLASDRPVDQEVTFFRFILFKHFLPACMIICLLQILSQDMLKKYLTYAKLNVFPKLHDADLDKLTIVYAELRRESSVRIYSKPASSIYSMNVTFLSYTSWDFIINKRSGYWYSMDKGFQ